MGILVSYITFRTLRYGDFGIFNIVGDAGFESALKTPPGKVGTYCSCGCLTRQATFLQLPLNPEPPMPKTLIC